MQFQESADSGIIVLGFVVSGIVVSGNSSWWNQTIEVQNLWLLSFANKQNLKKKHIKSVHEGLKCKYNAYRR